jgi:hypothetical protein
MGKCIRCGGRLAACGGPRYANADNGNGWVAAFHASLENWLGILGIKARIWRDRRLGGGDVFSGEILEQLKQSGPLISILSPNGMRLN